jgi:diguanylate cyclase (GGDEF)-like protein
MLPNKSSTALSEAAKEPPASQLLDLAASLLDRIVAEPDPGAQLADDLKNYPAFKLFYAKLLAIRESLLALVNGDLSKELHLKGFLPGILKALQGNLRHLTWQAQMIASGDFSQRIDFMGEFSEAFNTMVIQLDENQKQIKEKQAALMRLNEELSTEIELRKMAEISLRQSEESYRQLAITDPLTGIFNRRQFFKLALAELERTCRYKHPLALIIFDLDHFKVVNDTYGHAAGDQVLQAFAGLVGASVRNVDIFARYGGEEFILLAPETSPGDGIATAERLRRQVASAPLLQVPKQIAITISAGVSAFHPPESLVSPPAETLEKLICQADQALYEAKNSGRNQVQSSSFPATLDISV